MTIAIRTVMRLTANDAMRLRSGRRCDRGTSAAGLQTLGTRSSPVARIALVYALARHGAFIGAEQEYLLAAQA